MRLHNYLQERKKIQKSEYLYGITFVDIDECLANTFAKIVVRNKETKKEVLQLDNQEFNSYVLKDDEEYDFGQFGNSELFVKTSVPIENTVKRIKKMINGIKQYKERSKSKVIFLTARADFDNKQVFLQWFKDIGIDVDFTSNVYIERVGNVKTGTIPDKKKDVVLRYLKESIFRRVRMLDDHKPNVTTFLNIAKELPSNIIEKTKKNANITDNNEPIITFYGLQVLPTGQLSLLGEEKVY